MSLVFASFAPHPPILIPNVGKEHSNILDKTKQALELLEQELYSAKPDVLFVISPHGELHHSYFTVNLSHEFTADFEIFGDLETELKFIGETIIFSSCKENINNRVPLNIISQKELDHGISVPLFYLLKHLPQLPIVPIYFSMLDSHAHYEFGRALKDLILKSDKRIAVVASGDLSHALSNDSPAPFHPDGKIFDDKVIKAVETEKLSDLMSLDPKLIDNANECGLKSLMILAGILSDMKFKSKIINYENPLGIGYLTAQMTLD